ncbi:MAG: arabinose isomerase [Lentisphaerae bacterium]|nr:arabinose isomerase [Lentisphaerota bacterium]
MENTCNIGLVGLGLDTYWGQFPQLKSNLESYQKFIAAKMQRPGIAVVNTGIVDSVEAAKNAADELKQSGVELVFLYISTYALSSTVLPIVRHLNVPVVLLNLQPTAQLDYHSFNAQNDRGLMTGIWLENCQACSLPEISCVFARVGIRSHLVSGYLDDPAVWREIDDFLDAAKVKYHLRRSNIGILGQYYCGMLDVYSDLTALSGVFGCHFDLIEFCQLAKEHRSIVQEEIAAKRQEMADVFDISCECSEDELNRAAKTSCALDKLVEHRALDAMAYYYESVEDCEYQNIVTSVIAGNTLLTGRHLPVAGECEVRNVIAMKILDLLEAGGSFSELYLADYKDDIVFWGHDGPAHFSIAEGRTGLVPVPVYHGKPGKGLSIQMTVRHGACTLLAVVQGANSEISLLVAEGESVPGEVLQIGNTNSRYKFPLPVKEFLKAWCAAAPSHHCAIGVGHVAEKIEKLAALYNIKVIRVC